MAKQTWKAGNMLYPLPAVMVSVTDGKGQVRSAQILQWFIFLFVRAVFPIIC